MRSTHASPSPWLSLGLTVARRTVLSDGTVPGVKLGGGGDHGVGSVFRNWA